MALTSSNFRNGKLVALILGMFAISLVATPDLAWAGKGGSTGGGGKGGGKGGGGSTPPPPTNTGYFSCRGSAARLNLLSAIVIEPSVANPPEAPCTTDADTLLGIDLSALGISLNTGVLIADTESGDAPVNSEGTAVGVDLSLGLLLNIRHITADVLTAEARVESEGGVCKLAGRSEVASAVIDGTPISLLNDPMDIDLGIATVHLNATILEPTRIVQRALWIQVLDTSLIGANDIVIGEAIANFDGGNPCAVPDQSGADKRRMTGGGSFGTVTHGMALHCDVTRTPNNLEVNWNNGHRFHLDTMTSANCTDDPTIDPGQPAATFDTHTGSGTGTYDGTKGYTMEWVFTDAGEPGKGSDHASIRIYKTANGTEVLNTSGRLASGNHQAHD